MTTQYETLRHEDTYREAFGVEPPAALGERLLWPRKPGCFIVHQAVATALLSPEPATPLAADAVEFNAADDTAAPPHPRAGACAMGAGAALGQVSV